MEHYVLIYNSYGSIKYLYAGPDAQAARSIQTYIENDTDLGDNVSDVNGEFELSTWKDDKCERVEYTTGPADVRGWYQ